MPEETTEKPSSPEKTPDSEELQLVLRDLKWIAQVSGLSIRTLRLWASQKMIPGAVELPGRTYLFHEKDVKAWLAGRNTLPQLDKYDPLTTQVLWVFWNTSPQRADCDKLRDHLKTRVGTHAKVEQSLPLGRPRQFSSSEMRNHPTKVI
jgi:hypothetical protein